MATKRLQLGKEKCFKIHVGKNCPSTCPDLNVHQDVMQTTSSEKYLGDIITNAGKIDENIQHRANKGNGTVNSILSLIEEISFGHHTFEMGILFRNSMLINSILSSSETLYGITTKHIEILEKCDRDLLTRLFSVPFTCSYEAVYLETGCLPIKFILQGRRLMFYWTILNKPENELVKKVFLVQSKHSSKDDWFLQIQEDKNTLDIKLTENEIKSMKKEAFKKLVKQKLKSKASEFLLNYKSQENRTKTKNLRKFGLQEYLKSDKLSTKEKRLLFSLRTRMINVKTNYKNKYKFNMQCSTCNDKNYEESEVHLLNCKKILENINDDINLKKAKYENIFSDNLEEQIVITKIFDKVLKTRTMLQQQ